MTDDDPELARARAATAQALEAWQEAGRRFDLADPELPVRWDNWREAKAREKRRKAFLKDAARRLDEARQRARDIICRQLAEARGERR